MEYATPVFYDDFALLVEKIYSVESKDSVTWKLHKCATVRSLKPILLAIFDICNVLLVNYFRLSSDPGYSVPTTNLKVDMKVKWAK